MLHCRLRAPSPARGKRSCSDVKKKLIISGVKKENKKSNMCSCFSTRPISDDEIKNLKEHRYAAISDKQIVIDQKLRAEVRPPVHVKIKQPSLFHFVFNLCWLTFNLLHCFFCFCNFLFCFFIYLFFPCLFHFIISAQLEAQEEKLRLEEEARNAAQREAARLARERKLKEVRRY